ncbi:hypothetical protein [Hyphomicrobium zavarzinii]|uniref:hypothetical protein n=1 Tax=Hyphomicrobium zavarzinii TaxID=48292 RepID=UPI00036524BF|nr:hypothetical protein [Hyphomicrobium zavarzinii]
MTLFLDTEFNGFGGPLISIGLVSDSGRREDEFYGVRALPADPTPWVAENGLPVLGAKSISDAVLQAKLLDYLHRHRSETIVADWHEDLIHLLRLLETSPGNAYRPDLTMRLIRPTEPIVSTIPHNALHDSKALRRWYLSHAA